MNTNDQRGCNFIQVYILIQLIHTIEETDRKKEKGRKLPNENLSKLTYQGKF